MTDAQLAKCRLALPGLRWSLTSERAVGNRVLHRVLVSPAADGSPRWVAQWTWVYSRVGSQTLHWERASLASALHAVGREMQREAGKLAALAGLRAKSCAPSPSPTPR